MNKIYKTRIPVSMYAQLIGFTILALNQFRFTLLAADSIFFFVIFMVYFLIITIVIVVLLIKILRKNNKLEITEDSLKLNNVEVPISRIEKIITQGYFIESLGIKLHGKKYILNDLHFRFKGNEEECIKEFKKWAAQNGIEVTNGRIKRWI